jgi:predicted small secreted protein
VKKTLYLTAIFLTLILTACNTIHGLGEDIEKTADWTKQKL